VVSTVLALKNSEYLLLNTYDKNSPPRYLPRSRVILGDFFIINFKRAPVTNIANKGGKVSFITLSFCQTLLDTITRPRWVCFLLQAKFLFRLQTLISNKLLTPTILASLL